MNEEQFTELRKLLALKRYERPPTEFRSEFMAEFRRRRQEVDEARRNWSSRLWLWLVPDWTGALRNAAAAAVLALVLANVVVIQSRPHIQRAQLAVIIAPTVGTTASLQAPLPYATVEPSSNEIAYYLLMQDFYDQSEKIYGDNATIGLVQPVNFVAEDSGDAF